MLCQLSATSRGTSRLVWAQHTITMEIIYQCLSHMFLKNLADYRNVCDFSIPNSLPFIDVCFNNWDEWPVFIKSKTSPYVQCLNFSIIHLHKMDRQLGWFSSHYHQLPLSYILNRHVQFIAFILRKNSFQTHSIDNALLDSKIRTRKPRKMQTVIFWRIFIL